MTPVEPRRSDRLAQRSLRSQVSAGTAIISDTIHRSWLRCQQLGLQARAELQVEPVPRPRLQELRESRETLLRLAQTELALLSEDIGATGSALLLSDERGWILHAEGSRNFLQRADQLALRPGSCWSEAALGTNAIGTAIAEGRPVEVRGAEHYFAQHGMLSCVAAPIFDPAGALAGVLDISSDGQVQQLHALGLIRLAVAHIEHRYFDTGIDGCELMRLHSNHALLGTAGEGLLGFRSGRLVAANQAGLSLLGVDRSEIGRLPYEALFDRSPSHLQRDGVIHDRHGQILHGTVDYPRHHAVPASASQGGAAARPRPEPTMLLSPPLQQELTRAGRVLEAGLPVLLQGETGSGKEVFARELHQRGSRADQPFVAINCAALPESLIEAELFGYEEGAFTGARRKGNPGLLRQASGGVLFLDEIGDMPLALQPRLLRVLQERELLPLGAAKPVSLDFALICATHRDLEQLIAAQQFRADLYYRIAHHGVRLPPLREQADLRQTVQELWCRVGQGRQLTAAALNLLADYSWPGNLRQLSACLRTLAALHDLDTAIDTQALPTYVRPRQPSKVGGGEPDITQSLDRTPLGELETITEQVIQETLRACGGNLSRAARRLGISRSTLYRRGASGSKP